LPWPDIFVPRFRSSQTDRAVSCADAGVTRVERGVNLLGEERAMPAIDPDDLPKKKITHELGQELTLLSVNELTERIQLLKGEITRLEADISKKQASQAAANAFFKK
jgi:uncharacterized small protein (DUF1192 family)